MYDACMKPSDGITFVMMNNDEQFEEYQISFYSLIFGRKTTKN